MTASSGYLYRNPQLQMDLPQHEPDSRLLLNHETSRYLRLGLREFDWLNRIDGQVQESDIAGLFGIEPALAHELVTRLIAAKLVCVSVEPVQVKAVSAKNETQLANRRFEWVQFGQLRLHIARPKAFLTFLSPLTRLLMHRATASAVVLFILGSLFIAVDQIPELSQATRGFAWNAPHLLEIICLLLCVTVVHEFGHAAACDYLGAPVRSIGIMIYYLQPAAYADTTDSWQLPNRWSRVAIASAGIYVQAIITCFALITWSLLRLAHRPMDMLAIFVGINVSIIFFNLTPFVRLDGYWILSNVLGLPNLRDRAIEWFRANVFALVARRSIQARELRYSAVLNMTPIGKGLLFVFGLTSTWFEVAMWIAGVGFLFRIARFLHIRASNSYWLVSVICVGFIIMFFVKRWFEQKRTQAKAAPQQSAKSNPSIVVHRIDPEQPVKLNPHLTVLSEREGTFIFGWSSGTPLTVNAPASLSAMLPVLRSGTKTIDAIRLHPDFRPDFEDVLQQLWHSKLLRYSADWESSGDEVRYSRLLGWLSMNKMASGEERSVLERLHGNSVTILGIGGLGTHVAWNLAACGIGELHLVDGDRVELSNLNRQLFFTPEDVGRYKVDAAADCLLRFNPQLRVRKTYDFVQDVDDVSRVIKGSNHVVRALDMPVDAPLMVNEACVRLGIPYTGAGFFSQGTAVGPTVIPGVSACLACTPMGELKFDRGNFGTIAPLVTATAGLLSNEVVVCLAGLGTAKSINHLIWIDAPELNFRFQEAQRNEGCAVCGKVAKKGWAV